MPRHAAKESPSGKHSRRSIVVWTLVLIAWVAFMWGHSLANGVISSSESSRAVRLLRPLLEAMGFSNEHDMTYFVRKTAHFCEYAVMGMLLYKNGLVRGRNRRDGSGWWVAIALAIPVADEFIQSFVDGRSSLVSDVVLDFVGAGCGLLVVLGIRRLLRLCRHVS